MGSNEDLAECQSDAYNFADDIDDDNDFDGDLIVGMRTVTMMMTIMTMLSMTVEYILRMEH